MPAPSKEILAAQAAYAARPYAVRWVDSHCSTTQRLDTLDECFEYVQQLWAAVQARVANNRHECSKLHWSYIQTPDGQKMPLAYVLLAADVSSYF